jgi:hypothetical protein
MSVPTENRAATTAVRPFRVGVAEEDLEGLRRRIEATRWPERETVHDDSQGVPLATMQALARSWGDGLRLAQPRSQAERPAPVHDRARRPRHPLPPRPLPPCRRPAADRHPRLAGLDHRAAEAHRAPHRPHRPRWQRGRRLRCGDPLPARSRVLGQADHHRLGPDPDRACLGRADGPPWLHPVRGPGRRLGRGRDPGHGHPGAPGAGGHPLQHGRPPPQRWSRASRAATHHHPASRRRNEPPMRSWPASTPPTWPMPTS